MLTHIKTIFYAAGLALAAFFSFFLGGRLKEGRYNKERVEELEEALNKAKEADEKANAAKNNVNTANVTDVLNGL
jgi:hypothetical protein